MRCGRESLGHYSLVPRSHLQGGKGAYINVYHSRVISGCTACHDLHIARGSLLTHQVSRLLLHLLLWLPGLSNHSLIPHVATRGVVMIVSARSLRHMPSDSLVSTRNIE